jgi:hypothetical protein
LPRPGPHCDKDAQPEEAVETGRRIVKAAGTDVGAVESLETPEGRRVLYDVNATSTPRRPVAAEHGFDPVERVADHRQAAAGATRERPASPA